MSCPVGFACSMPLQEELYAGFEDASSSKCCAHASSTCMRVLLLLPRPKQGVLQSVKCSNSLVDIVVARTAILGLLLPSANPKPTIVRRMLHLAGDSDTEGAGRRRTSDYATFMVPPDDPLSATPSFTRRLRSLFNMRSGRSLSSSGSMDEGAAGLPAIHQRHSSTSISAGSGGGRKWLLSSPGSMLRTFSTFAGSSSAGLMRQSGECCCAFLATAATGFVGRAPSTNRDLWLLERILWQHND